MKRWRRPDFVRWVGWEPRDLWVGVYWNRSWVARDAQGNRFVRWDVYVCLVPCFPIRMIWIER